MHKLALRYLTALAAVILGATLIARHGAVVRAQSATNPPVILVPGETNGIVLAPGTSATLPVSVTDSQGNPLAGATVLFVAPDHGASGAFTNGDPSDSTVLRVATGSDGSASAIFTASSTTGVFLVDAIVENQDAGITFAVTVSNDPGPAVPPDQARQAVLQQLFPGMQEGVDFQLYGPVLLPAGSVTASDGASTDLYPTTPSNVSAQSWFFWSEATAGLFYAHDTQFITLDASDPAATPVITKEGWWPNVTLPGGAAAPLLPVSVTRAGVPPAGGLAIRPQPRSTLVTPAADISPQDTCVIAIYGPDSAAASNDQQAMKDFAINTLGVPAGNVFTGTNLFGGSRPASVNMFKSFVMQAKQKGCKRLIVSISGHGGGGQVVLANDANTGEDSLEFTDLGEILSTFQGTGTDVDVIITSCYSGAAVAAMQNHGFSGTVVTSSDRTSSSWASRFAFGRPSSFLGALIDAWKDPNNSSTPGQMPSLMDAFNKVKKDDGTFACWGNPQSGAIMPNGYAIGAPDFSIAYPGSTATITISSPPNANGKMRINVTIAKGAIATFDDGTTQAGKVLTPGQSVTFTFVGVAPGTTPYTISAVDSLDYPYNGTGTITVGSPYSVNSPINMKVGDKQVAAVTRPPSLAKGAVTLNITPANSASTGIATVDVKSVTFQAGETAKTFNVTGVSAGTATYNLVDPATGASATLIINVTAPSNTTGCNFQSAQMNLQFAVFQDLKNSAMFVGLFNGMLKATRSGSMVSVTGDRTQLVPAMGTFNASTCTFDITGVSTGPIAGVSNVHCEYNLTIDPAKLAVTGKYSVGTQMDLFGEPPVIYNVTGTAALF